MGRPKGRRYYPYSINLTPEQGEWMKSQPNSSELVRGMVDQLMKSGDDAVSNILGLKAEIDALEAKLEKAQKEYWSYKKKDTTNPFYRYEYQKEIMRKWIPMGSGYAFFENTTQTGEERTLNIRRYTRRPDISEYNAKILDAYEENIRSLDAEITEKKRQLLSMPL